MKETEREELTRLLVVHAKIYSHRDPKVEQMAEAQPQVLASVIETLEDRLRKLAGKLARRSVASLVDKLAADNPELDFTGTRKLLGL